MRLGVRLLASVLILTMYLPVGVAQASGVETIQITGLNPVETPGVSDLNVVVTAFLDGTEDPAYGGMVHFTTTDPSFSLPGDYTFDGSEGHHSFSVTLNTVGPQTVTVTDDGSLTDSMSTYVDNPPVANPDSKTVAENAASTAINVLANDTDVDSGDTLTVSSVTDPPHGTATVDPFGAGVHYTPTTNYSGPDSFTYALSDGHGGTDNSTVTVTVTHVNQNPVANPDSKTVAENAASTAFNVLANDTDVDSGDTLTVSSVTDPPHGTASVDPFGAGVHYTPTTNYSGPDSVSYTHLRAHETGRNLVCRLLLEKT